MRILKRYKDFGEKRWGETTLEECIEHTEGSGYYKHGSVETMLKNGILVQTDFALYKKAGI